MVTAYSPILKLALPVQGELSGTWGDVVNDNITSMVEQAIAGRAVIDTWTTNSHVLTTANGTTSESRCAMLEFTDTGTALSGAGTVTCPTLSKIYIAKNASGQNVTLKTSGGTGILVPNGRTMFLFCDGTNVVEAVTSTTSLQLGTSTIVTAVLDEDNMASDSATSLATQQSIKAYVDSQVGANNELSEVLANGNTSGANDIIMTSGQKITTNTIDETTAASGVTIDSVLLKDDGVNATNLEITNIKANDGTAAGSIADSTGVVTILSSILTTADINGGTADGVIIGGTTPAAATVTNLIANTDLIIAGTTTITAVLDEDNMASDSATALATQQSIKAYVDSQVGTVDTLAEILAIGNTTGATDIAVDSAQKVQFRDAAIYINSSVDGQLDIVADTEIQIAATTVDLNGALDVSGTALVTGVLTTTAATVSNGGGQFNGAINVGVDDTGYDVKFFGATAGAYMLWDESADDLILGGAAGLSVNSTALVTGVLTTTAATVFNGGFAANVGSTITTADNTSQLTLISTDADASGGPVLDFFRNSASPADGDDTGQIRLQGKNDAGETISYVSMGSQIADMTDGTEDGKFYINTVLGGSNVSRIYMTDTETIFNDSASDLDFRVESATDANALFVQGSDGFVGIGASSPAAKLQVGWGSDQLQFTNPSAGKKRIGASYTGYVSDNIYASMDLQSAGSSGGDISFNTTPSGGSLTERLRIDESGRVLIGYTANTTIGDFNSATQVVGQGTADYHGASSSIIGFSNNSNGSYLNFASGRSNTAGTYTIVADDDTIGQINFAAADGTDMASRAALIQCQVDGTPGADDMPGRLQFFTTADGASSPTERMRITNAGNVEIGFSASDVNGKLNVNGNVGIGNYLATSNPTGGAFSFTDPDSATIIGILRVGDDDGANSGVADLQIISYGSSDDDGGGNIRFINSRYSKETGLIKSSRQSTNTGYMDFYTENGSGLQRAMRIDSSGSLLVGTSSARSYTTGGAGGNHKLQLETAGATSVFTTAGIYSNSDVAGIGAYLELGRSKGTALGAVTAVALNDILGEIRFAGTNGTAADSAASIAGYVDGAVSGGGANDMPGRLVFSTTADGASTPTERLRIDSSGNVSINTVTATNGVLTIVTDASPTKPNLYLKGYPTSNPVAFIYRDNTDAQYALSLKHDGPLDGAGTGYMALFLDRGDVTRGSITISGASTVYATSSDYRLKEDWQLMSGASDRVLALKPVNFAWIESGTRVDGFLAHELADVVPEAVTGTKDAVGADGKPEYQGIDQSKLVPLLTAALQEALTKIETLEARITALENA